MTRGITNLDVDEQTSLTACYRAMALARQVDAMEARLVAAGEAFFHVSGAGHEASAMLAPLLTADDWLHCHYRDKALMLARGISAEMFFHSLLCTEASHSRGRQMSAHLSAPELNVLSLVGPVGNNALQAAGVAAALSDRGEAGLVLCAMGDGTTQEGEVYEALAEARSRRLPLLFLVEDNGLAISTRTQGKTFYTLTDGPATDYLGIPIRVIDGRRPWTCREPLAEAVSAIRDGEGPQIVVMHCERLASHTNADDETGYRSDDEIAAASSGGDPLINLRDYLIGEEPALADTLGRIDLEVRREVSIAAEAARPAIGPTRTPLPARKPTGAPASAEHRVAASERRHTMVDTLRLTLKSLLADDPRVMLLGEDIEDPKGDVFGVTRGLSTAYPGRVLNSALSEGTIAGTSIGRALAGQRPIAFLQFADFLPIAFNQIATELGSLEWRTDGAWRAPVIFLMPCGGYRPGLGPFHSHTFESIVAHVPGIDVVMPSHAADAAGLLRAAYESERPTIFLYPKALLNARDRMAAPDFRDHPVPLGAACIERAGSAATLVAWGNTVEVCHRACHLLADLDLDPELIDLRSLVPWDLPAVLASVRKTGHLIVVHEDNHTCGFGAEVVATVTEAIPGCRVRRVTRPDTYVPCNFEDQLATLPSARRVVDAVADLLGMPIQWDEPARSVDGVHVVEAQSSTPSDESMTVMDWHVAPGQDVEAGDILADMEAEKAAFELVSPVAGTVQELLTETGIAVARGVPIATIKTADGPQAHRIITREEPGTPRRAGRAHVAAAAAEPTAGQTAGTTVQLLGAIGHTVGDRVVTNAELAERFPDMSAEDITQRCGIQSRRWCADGVTVPEFGVRAVEDLLTRTGLALQDFDALICATTTAQYHTPSTACQILELLTERHGPHEMPAHDVAAACSGWLYAIANAHDMVKAGAAQRVLVVTAELLSPYLKPDDFDTVILFGDGATATVIAADSAPLPIAGQVWQLHRPILAASGRDSSIIRLSREDGIYIEGARVFKDAVRSMATVLNRACADQGLTPADLDLLAPHQANARILEAMLRRLDLADGALINRIDGYGNTSSSSIPLALALTPRAAARTIGLCAFGGGLTYGAALLTTPD